MRTWVKRTILEQLLLGTPIRDIRLDTMKSFLALLAAVATASAHYTFPALIADGKTTDQWQYVRKTTNYQSNGPVTDVSPL
jgi:hypothetical protein